MNTFLCLFTRVGFFGAALALLLSASRVARAETSSVQTEPAFSVQVIGHGSPVYFVPGLGCSGEVWTETVKKLSPNHECHVFTLAGFAGHPAIKEEFFPAVEAALSSYVHAHAASHPVLVGHSLGGLLSLKVAADNPDAVSRLVIVDSLPFFAGMMTGATPEGARQYAQGLRSTLEQQPRDAFLAGSRQGLPMLVTSEASQRLVYGWMEKSDQKTVAQAMSAVMSMDARGDVARVQCPLLLVEAGAGRGAVPTAIYAEQYSTAKTLSRVRIEDAEHFVMLDQPDRFISELTRFISAHP